MEQNGSVPNFAYLAWLGAVAAVIVLLALLGLPRTAAAQTPPPTDSALLAAPAELEEDDEGGEEEVLGDEQEELDQCESEDEAAEEACEEALEEREAEAIEAEECRIESAEATVAAAPRRNQIRLTVRYKTFQPSAVAIDLRLHGAKGALDLGTETARFGRAGAFHTTQTVTDPQMARAVAAKEFTVEMHAINTPRFCGDAFERHLSARKGLQWTDPSATRRAKASRS